MVGCENCLGMKPVVDVTYGGTLVAVCSWGRMSRALRKVKVVPDCVATFRKGTESWLNT